MKSYVNQILIFIGAQYKKREIVLFFIKRVLFFYYDGFRNMKIGKKLWGIILIKLFIMFAILKIFFFPDALALQQKDNKSKADVVFENFINH